jgi:crotonobetainyl-CoA:carnitine CoA-transferase CaiB-like acyl-CoA transferase
MNGGKQSLALDIDSDLGRRQLQALLERADIVIESNRPRALRQLGIEPAAIVRGRPGLTWLCITGYGQDEPESSWVAFGDDAAAAAGLTATADCGTPVFCGDAVADPLTGLHATVAALASWLTGGGRLLDISLRNVAAKVATVAAANPGRATTQPRPPRARPVSQAAAPLGRDTDRVLAELGIRC